MTPGRLPRSGMPSVSMTIPRRRARSSAATPTTWGGGPQAGPRAPIPGPSLHGRPRTPRKTIERAAVRKAIEAVVAAGRAIYWLGDYYEPRRGQWERQDVAHYRRLITRTISQVQKSIDGVALVGRLTMHSYLDALQDAVTPACVDTALLAEDDRLELFNLDTGELVSGAAFPERGSAPRGPQADGPSMVLYHQPPLPVPGARSRAP